MEFNTTLRISFPDKDNASILLETTATGDTQKFSEILLFSLYVIRMIYNLGDRDPVYSLTNKLNMFADIGEFSYLGSSTEILSSYKPAKKTFEGILKYSDDNLFFDLNANGFGFLGSKVDKYAPISVEVLAKYLMNTRQEDDVYLKALKDCAKDCYEAFMASEINLTNQHSIAFAIATKNYNL